MDMKITKFTALILGLIVMGSLMIVSCSKTEKTNTLTDETNNETNHIEFVTVNDSIAGKGFENKISLAYPVKGNAAYIDSVRMWIYTILNNNPFVENGEIKIFNGDKNDAKAVAKYYMTKRMPSKKDIEELISISSASFGCEDEVKVTFLGKNITSMINTNYIYTGGAHGSTIVLTSVFDNNTGKKYVLGDMIEDTAILKNYIIQGLIKYFEVKTENDMRELLFDRENIILPQTEPYFTKDGLTFIYQQYEIAAYAYGMPEITIEWKDCKNILKKTFFEKIDNDVKK